MLGFGVVILLVAMLACCVDMLVFFGTLGHLSLLPWKWLVLSVVAMLFGAVTMCIYMIQ